MKNRFDTRIAHGRTTVSVHLKTYYTDEENEFCLQASGYVGEPDREPFVTFDVKANEDEFGVFCTPDQAEAFAVELMKAVYTARSQELPAGDVTETFQQLFLNG